MNGTLGLAMRALHVLGVTAWIGGVVVAALIVAFASEDVRRGTAAAARKAALYVAAPGLVLTWLVGLAVLLPNFGDIYARAGWMHGKLTLALIAAGLTGALSGALRKAAAGEAVAPGKLRGLAIAVLALATLVTFLVFLRPFAG